MKSQLKKGWRFTQILMSLVVVASTFQNVRADETVTVNVSKIKDLSLRIYGFVETDIIHDSTQGQPLTEEPDNPLVAKGNTWAGSHSKTIMSIRNSRLGSLDLAALTMESGNRHRRRHRTRPQYGNNAP